MNKTLKTIIIAAVILGAMAAAFALGASGKLTAEKQQDDRLAGVLLTTQPLTESGDGRVYAEYIDEEYVFKGTEGIRCFFTKENTNAIVTHTDEPLTDVDAGMNMVDDEQETCWIKANIYISTEFDGAIYTNNVYQTESGEVYAVEGSGMEWTGGLEDTSNSISVSDSVSAAYENGKTKSCGTSIELTLKYIAAPEKIIVSQFDGEGRLLSNESFTSGELPDSMESSAAYIVVGTVSQSGTQYEVFQPSNESLKALYCRDDKICVMQRCLVNWEDR